MKDNENEQYFTCSNFFKVNNEEEFFELWKQAEIISKSSDDEPEIVKLRTSEGTFYRFTGKFVINGIKGKGDSLSEFNKRLQSFVNSKYISYKSAESDGDDLLLTKVVITKTDIKETTL